MNERPDNPQVGLSSAPLPPARALEVDTYTRAVFPARREPHFGRFFFGLLIGPSISVQAAAPLFSNFTGLFPWAYWIFAPVLMLMGSLAGGAIACVGGIPTYVILHRLNRLTVLPLVASGALLAVAIPWAAHAVFGSEGRSGEIDEYPNTDAITDRVLYAWLATMGSLTALFAAILGRVPWRRSIV